MKSITFECETITPMFLAGADGSTPELRAPSIKGMMRFWWRAARAYDDIGIMKCDEGKIFGSSTEGMGKSKFSISINNDRMKKGEYRPLPHSENKKFKRPSFCTGSKFSISIRSQRSSKEEFSLYLNTLEIAFLLGGLGKRSRRGFGSVHLNVWNFKNEEELVEYIILKLNSIQNIFKKSNKAVTNEKKSRADYPFIAEISVCSMRSNADELLNLIGNASHIHPDKSLGFAGKHKGKDIRMSSPVIVSIIRVGDKHCPIVTTLNPAFPTIYPPVDFDKQKKFKDSI